jgi:hypothetical protein
MTFSHTSNYTGRLIVEFWFLKKNVFEILYFILYAYYIFLLFHLFTCIFLPSIPS